MGGFLDSLYQLRMTPGKGEVAWCGHIPPYYLLLMKGDGHEGLGERGMDKGKLTHYPKDLGPGKDVGLESGATVECLSFFPYKSQEVHGLPKPQIR